MDLAFTRVYVFVRDTEPIVFEDLFCVSCTQRVAWFQSIPVCMGPASCACELRCPTHPVSGSPPDSPGRKPSRPACRGRASRSWVPEAVEVSAYLDRSGSGSNFGELVDGSPDRYVASRRTSDTDPCGRMFRTATSIPPWPMSEGPRSRGASNTQIRQP